MAKKKAPAATGKIRIDPKARLLIPSINKTHVRVVNLDTLARPLISTTDNAHPTPEQAADAAGTGAEFVAAIQLLIAAGLAGRIREELTLFGWDDVAVRLEAAGAFDTN